VRVYGDHFDLITMSGELYAKNYKDTDIFLKVNKHLTGEVIEARERFVEAGADLSRPEQDSKITWKSTSNPARK